MGALVRAATILAKGRAKPVNALVKRHGEAASIEAATRADTMLISDCIGGRDVMIGENINEFEPGPHDVSI